MERCFIDCRELPSASNCSLRMSGTPDELERAAVMHAVDAHGEKPSPGLHRMIRRLMRSELRESLTNVPAPH